MKMVELTVDWDPTTLIIGIQRGGDDFVLKFTIQNVFDTWTKKFKEARDSRFPTEAELQVSLLPKSKNLNCFYERLIKSC